MIVELEDARAQRAIAMIDGKLPAGCDYQGRHYPRPYVDTMPVQPVPAEACTELGNDDDDGTRGSFRLLLVIVVTTGVPFVLALVSWVVSLMPTGIAQP